MKVESSMLKEGGEEKARGEKKGKLLPFSAFYFPLCFFFLFFPT
jgi:hypothetical protein